MPTYLLPKQPYIASEAGLRWQSGDHPLVIALRNLLFVSPHLAEERRRVDIDCDCDHQIR
jgi:hypothetical protein